MRSVIGTFKRSPARFPNVGQSKFAEAIARLLRFHWFYFFICLRQVGGDPPPDFRSRFFLQQTLTTPIIYQIGKKDIGKAKEFGRTGCSPNIKTYLQVY